MASSRFFIDVLTGQWLCPPSVLMTPTSQFVFTPILIGNVMIAVLEGSKDCRPRAVLEFSLPTSKPSRAVVHAGFEGLLFRVCIVQGLENIGVG